MKATVARLITQTFLFHCQSLIGNAATQLEWIWRSRSHTSTIAQTSAGADDHYLGELAARRLDFWWMRSTNKGPGIANSSGIEPERNPDTLVTPTA
jgi:hypothetical protein